MQQILSEMIGGNSDEEIVERLEEWGLHPDKIEILAKLKSNHELVIPRQRKKRLRELFEKKEETAVQSVVKFIDPAPTPKPPLTNDPFTLNWT
jgi:antitoxin component of MazEF toxin-antitoxin module